MNSEHDKVYFAVIEHIKTLAEKGEISFGSKIPSERELMATLGLSRNSIREAIRSLENMGLIESRHGQGNYLVNHMGQSLSTVFSMLLFTEQSDYVEISQLRRFIEIGAYLLAVKAAGKEELRRLAYYLDKMDTCKKEERAKADKQFHDELIQISGNNMLVILNEALSELFARIISDISEQISPDNWEKVRTCHKEVYKNLENKNVQEGIRVIREHYNVIDEELGRIAQEKKGRH